MQSKNPTLFLIQYAQVYKLRRHHQSFGQLALLESQDRECPLQEEIALLLLLEVEGCRSLALSFNMLIPLS